MEKSKLETRLTSGQGRERDTLTTVGSVNSDIEVSMTLTTLATALTTLILPSTNKLMMHLNSSMFKKMLTKLKEELKSCQKELDASKEVSKKLMSEKILLDQKVQRLERMKSEEVISLLVMILIFFSVLIPRHQVYFIFLKYGQYDLCRKAQWKRFMRMNAVN